jgi:hypothetical protein
MKIIIRVTCISSSLQVDIDSHINSFTSVLIALCTKINYVVKILKHLELLQSL